MAAEQIERLAREYDHVVIDSPPALAFPGCLGLGQAGGCRGPGQLCRSHDGAGSQGGQGAVRPRAGRVLGAILSNVPLEQGLYRYAYTYRTRAGATKARQGGSCCWRPRIRKPGTMAALPKLAWRCGPTVRFLLAGVRTDEAVDRCPREQRRHGPWGAGSLAVCPVYGPAPRRGPGRPASFVVLSCGRRAGRADWLDDAGQIGLGRARGLAGGRGGSARPYRVLPRCRCASTRKPGTVRTPLPGS